MYKEIKILGEGTNPYVSISKEKLAKLPTSGYKGEITLVESEDQVENALKELMTQPLVGFDTETRPSFRKGQCYNVSLIQLATPEKCFLFRTNLIGYPRQLIKFLEDPSVIKVGLSIHDDFHNLRRVTDIDPKGFIDLQSYVKAFNIQDNSLSRLYGILFGERISKSQRLSNWEAPELSEPQQMYAALDAYACVRIYKYLKEGNFNPETSQYLTYPPTEQEMPQ